MTSTRERQRAAARARLEKDMAERAAKARKRRQTQAVVAAAAVLLLVVAGTVWLAVTLGGDDDKTDNAASAPGASECVYNQLPRSSGPSRSRTSGYRATSSPAPVCRP
ncbi:hypothetical protein GCM10027614_76630 [Micromonospora vulcania]